MTILRISLWKNTPYACFLPYRNHITNKGKTSQVTHIVFTFPLSVFSLRFWEELPILNFKETGQNNPQESTIIATFQFVALKFEIQKLHWNSKGWKLLNTWLIWVGKWCHSNFERSRKADGTQFLTCTNHSKRNHNIYVVIMATELCRNQTGNLSNRYSILELRQECLRVSL